MKDTTNYDIILIGSGMGALTVAGLAARLRGKRVLVLERHFKAGGFTHDFKRGRFHWDVGLHYVGDMGEDSQVRQILDLVADNGVAWNKMPEPFERFSYPGLEFDLYGSPERFVADLVALFPDEAKAIRRYVRDVRKAANALFLNGLRRNGTRLLRAIGRLGGMVNPFDTDLTTGEYLDRRFRDPRLKSLLASQWGDYGLPPGRSAFAVHATIVNHYLNGAYYPVGGAGTIADAVKRTVEAAGGKFLVNREAVEILVENGRAVGVRVRKTNAAEPTFEEYFAPAIVSNAGAATTYLKLVPERHPIPFRDDLRRFLEAHPPATNVTLYVGLSDDPRKLGFRGENHWLYEDMDHDRAYAARSDWIEAGRPPQVYLSFPSLKDPSATAHTAEIIAFTGYDAFAKWRDQPWRHRDEAYLALKERIGRAMIDMIERRYPGFAGTIEFHELSTPLTNEHFTGHPKGGIYGLSAVLERFRPETAAWTRPESPIPGLYLTGADLYMGGIVPAMMAGVMTMSVLPDGVSLPGTFAAAAKFHRAGGQGKQADLSAVTGT